VPSREFVEATVARQAQARLTPAPLIEPRDWGYAGLVAFTVVLLFRPQDSIPGLGSIHIAEICAGVGLAPMLLDRFRHQRPMLRVTTEVATLALFGAVMLATAPFSVWPGGALGTVIDLYLKVLLVYILMTNTLTTPKRLEFLTWIILVSVGYVAIRGLIDYARGLNLLEDGRLSGPIGGIFGNPNDLALNMVTFLPVAVITSISPRHSAVRRLTACVIGALMLVATVLTKSRGGAIGLAVMLVSLVLLGRKVRPGFIVAAVGVIVLSMPLMPSAFWARMSSILDEQQDQREYTGSREARRELMQEGIDVFVERPLTGVGVGQFQNYNPAWRKERWREAHNALIQVASETGILGLLAFSFLIVRAFIAARSTRLMLRGPRRRGSPDPLAGVMSARDRIVLSDHATAMTIALIGWFTCALFASVAYNWTFYYLLALIASGHELTRDRLARAQALRHAGTNGIGAFAPRSANRPSSGIA
jgi:O-antigen ligase